MAWYDPGWLYRQKITIDHTRVAEDLSEFPVLITDAVTHASLFAHARSDGADIVVTAGDETARLKRELATYDAMAGELELYVGIPSLSSVTDTEVYVYYGNAGAGDERCRRLERRLRRRLSPERGSRRHRPAGQGQHRQCGARHL